MDWIVTYTAKTQKTTSKALHGPLGPARTNHRGAGPPFGRRVRLGQGRRVHVDGEDRCAEKTLSVEPAWRAILAPCVDFHAENRPAVATVAGGVGTTVALGNSQGLRHDGEPAYSSPQRDFSLPAASAVRKIRPADAAGSKARPAPRHGQDRHAIRLGSSTRRCRAHAART